MPNNSYFDGPVGLLRVGAIQDYDPDTGRMQVKLRLGTPIGPDSPPVEVTVTYFPLFMKGGIFIGTKPIPGTPVVVGQGEGNEYHFVSFFPEDLSQLPTLQDNEILIRANDKTYLTLNSKSNDIYLGSNNNSLHINTNNQLFTTRFYNQQNFTQSARQINGIVKRDKIISNKWALNNRINNDDYDSQYTVISLDPTINYNNYVSSANKNPPFVEQREMVYEFQQSSSIKDEISESLVYSSSGSSNIIYSLPNRRQSKADTLSLTLASPNYLMETVKGTVVDIFGNLLDINRAVLPIGQGQATLDNNQSTDKVASYKQIREIQRKGIAYHFEINSRKDFGKQITNATNISDLFGYDNKFPNSDYGRLRSRFFFDVDKEGQFKLNVPASSEKGNVSLLTRYENFSTISTQDNNNPDKLLANDDYADVLQDSFATPKLDLNTLVYSENPGSIKILSDGAEGAPKDRRYDNVYIKHGTAFHDILSTCYVHQRKDWINYPYLPDSNLALKAIESIPLLQNIVTDTIQVSGDNANAGGRSGSINFDGSIEMNVGANTVDRQSIWLDTAGGVVANIGRDLKNMSAAVSMNGDVFIQIGGLGVVGDSRFVKQQNGEIGAVLDLRVVRDGLTATMFRIDKDGVTLVTPGNLNIYSSGDMKISGKNLDIDVEKCYIQGRLVLKKIGGGSI